VAIPQHSSTSCRLSSVAPAAMTSPMLARIRQVTLATEAMNTHFSHISCTI